MSLSLCTSACAGMPRVSAAHLSLLRRCFASSFHKETFGGVVPKPKEDMLKKRDDPTMVQEVAVEDLPRAERRHVEQFITATEKRAKAMVKLSYKNAATFIVLFSIAATVYLYSYYGLRQETFLEEIDEEIAAEMAEKKT